MVSLISAGIKISVETFYQAAQSNPIGHEFMFAYRITIENPNNDRHEVTGDGVVGVQPIILPRDSFQYVSGCNLSTEMGRMVGYYMFENEDDKQLFEVKIPGFELVAPLKLN